MSFRTIAQFERITAKTGRNYYFSSMSFRTNMVKPSGRRQLSQLLFQQYVLSDGSKKFISRDRESQLLFQQYVLSDPIQEKCIRWETMSQLLFQQYVLSDLPMIFLYGAFFKVATTISAVCPFGQWTSGLRQPRSCRNYYFSSMSFRTLYG